MQFKEEFDCVCGGRVEIESESEIDHSQIYCVCGLQIIVSDKNEE